jgi:GAF domain-containing protein
LVGVESFRTELFGFGSNERYNMSLFMRSDDDRYISVARRSHAEIVRHDRSWALGEGQVGTAATLDRPLVTPDLTESSMRTINPAHRDADSANYRSVVSVPLLPMNGKADLVFIISTDRKGHFHGPRQTEVLTAMAVGHIFGTLWLVGGRLDVAHG